MTAGVECDTCKGEGLVPREGSEADADMHPIVSKFGRVCPTCGGGGKMTPELVKRRNRAAAAAQTS